MDLKEMHHQFQLCFSEVSSEIDGVFQTNETYILPLEILPIFFSIIFNLRRLPAKNNGLSLSVQPYMNLETAPKPKANMQLLRK